MEGTKIRAHLRIKYDNAFNFFLVKPINEMVYDKTTRIPNITFKDLTIVIDINEYLKRYYFFSNASSRNQIVERIKMLTEFYHNNLIMSYEYPMMIVTQTKNIFMKRMRRMKKMVAMEDSSDQSSSSSMDADFSVKTSNFIQSVDSAYSSQNKSNQIIKSEQLEFDDSVYNAYHNGEDEKGGQLSFNLKVEQQKIGLICDFDELDLQKAINVYKKAVKIIQQKKEKEVKINDQKKQKKAPKPVSCSIVITPIQYNDLKMQKNSKNGFGSPKRMNQQIFMKKNYYPNIVNEDFSSSLISNNYRKKKPTLEVEHFEDLRKKQTFKVTSPTFYQNHDFTKKNQNNRINAIKEKAVALLNGRKSHEDLKYDKYQGSKYY